MATGAEHEDPFAESRMSLIEHLGELRKRLLYCVLAVLVATFAAFHFAPVLFDFLLIPYTAVSSQKLTVLGPFDLVFTYMKLAILAAIFVTTPWILAQLWLFIAPGLYAHEKRWIAPFIIMGTLFFVAGGAFGFYVVIPTMFRFLVEMIPHEAVTEAYSVERYFTNVVQLLIAFGLIFELPLLMWVLAAAGVVQPQTFAKGRRYWLIASFVIGGVLTADPSPITMMMMAIPLILFWELGILGAKVFAKRRARAQTASTSTSTSTST
jgi:sec-independent protein translocase protein TatC